MPAKEIKELRKSGKLDEAYALAIKEFDEANVPTQIVNSKNGETINVEPNLLWQKRNLSWVYYDYIKLSCEPAKFEDFKTNLKKIVELNLPEDEKILFDQLAWQIGKMLFAIGFKQPKFGEAVFQPDSNRVHADELFEIAKKLSFTKLSEAYSFLFKAFHTAFKLSQQYVQFVDWWGLENFRKEDFEKEKLPNGKDVMSIAEQAYIAYAKHLLPEKSSSSQLVNPDKIKEFIPKLDKVIDDHPEFQYPPYFKAKLLLALGDKEHMLSALLPFARKKMNDFWVWEVLSEAVSAEDQILSCYCRALLCRTQEEFLIGIRQRIAALLIRKELYSEAKNEIELLVAARTEKNFKIPAPVSNWMQQDWFKNAAAADNNTEFYKRHQDAAEGLLFSDYPEEEIVVDFVNTDKKILNFVSTDERSGFFKYDRFATDVNIGDVLNVRFKEKKPEGLQQIYSVSKSTVPGAAGSLLKTISGKVRIGEGKNFGFVENVYIHPATIKTLNLSNGLQIKGTALKTYNSEKKEWGWKLFKVEP